MTKKKKIPVRTAKENFELGIDRFIENVKVVTPPDEHAPMLHSMHVLKMMTMKEFDFIEEIERLQK